MTNFTIVTTLNDAARIFGAVQVRLTTNAVYIELPGNEHYPIAEANWADAIRALATHIKHAKTENRL